MAHRIIIGTTGDDAGINAVIGNYRNNILIGQSGDDVLDGAGGRDLLFGGDGDDLLIFDRWDLIKDGGTGFDTLQVVDDNQYITLGRKSYISHIEAIDFVSTNNHLRLQARDIERISDNDTLTLTGDSGNVVDPGSGWQLLGVSTDGQFYHFIQSGVSLMVDTDIQVVGFSQSEPLIPTN